ncbi:hypothetical protein [Nocardioides sp.]|uniref:hypothetical protein n=1 Tax=Nocardioides sp. TaxID=35761 RepID=UPI003D0EFA37
MNLDEYLRVPYLLEAESVESAPDVWIRRASYPELPGCEVEGDSIVDVLDDLERLKIKTIMAMLETGQVPPVPRALLGSASSAYELARLGLTDVVASADPSTRP